MQITEEDRRIAASIAAAHPLTDSEQDHLAAPGGQQGPVLTPPQPVAWLCEWDGWSQYHDASDPLPEKWDDEAPKITPLYAAVPAPTPVPLTELNELAKAHATSYASPHHFTLTVEALRNIIEAANGVGGAA